MGVDLWRAAKEKNNIHFNAYNIYFIIIFFESISMAHILCLSIQILGDTY